VSTERDAFHLLFFFPFWPHCLAIY